MGNKFGNVLTMVLVIIIVAILGIMGYFAYDAFYTKKVDADAQSVLEEFEKTQVGINKDKTNSTTEVVKENKVSNTPTIPAEDPLNKLDNLMNTVETPQEPEQQAEPDKVYYKGYEVKGRIRIPKTKVDYPVLSPLTKGSLEIATAIAYGPGVNLPGNTIIFGHNYRNNMFFSNNDKLTNGDKIILEDQLGQKVTYEIYKIYQTSQNDASYMQRPVDIENGAREISLQTCTDNGKARIIIWAIDENQKNLIIPQ